MKTQNQIEAQIDKIKQPDLHYLFKHSEISPIEKSQMTMFYDYTQNKNIAKRAVAYIATGSLLAVLVVGAAPTTVFALGAGAGLFIGGVAFTALETRKALKIRQFFNQEVATRVAQIREYDKMKARVAQKQKKIQKSKENTNVRENNYGSNTVFLKKQERDVR